MKEAVKKVNGEEDAPEEEAPQFDKIEPQGKPELPPDMAAWLVQKLDTPIQLNNHADRNNFAAVINRLIAIANWKEPE